MSFISEEFSNLEGFNNLISNYEKKSPLYVYGLLEEVRAHFLCSFFEKTDKTILYLAENNKKAGQLVDDINNILDDRAYLFSDIDTSFYNIKNIDTKIKNERLEIINKLLNNEKIILVTTQKAISHKLTKISYLKENIISIDLDTEIDIDKLKQNFIKLKYEQVKLVENKGQFSVRGAIIDFWSVNEENPCRIELFDTEIDSMRFFNKDTQRSIENIEKIKILPASEMIFSCDDIEFIKKSIIKDIKQKEDHPDYGYDNKKVIDKFTQILSFLEDNMYIANEDLIINYLDEDRYSSICDYLPKDSVIFSGDIVRIYDSYSENKKMFLEEITYNMEKGEVFSSHQNTFIDFKDIMKEFYQFPIINITQIMRQSSAFKPNMLIEIKSIEEENFNRRIKDFAKSLISLSSHNTKILIFAGNRENAENISEIFNDQDFYPTIKDDISFSIDKKDIVIVSRNLSKGYYLPDINLNVFTHREIYGAQRHKRKKRRNKKLDSSEIINYSDLEIGDYVVHENNGIGKYEGIEKIQVTDTAKDYLVIKYRSNDKLYIPIDQISLIHKYIGNGDSAPKLSQLGGSDWSKAKQKAKKSIDEIAEDLVKLYAKRSEEKGYKFSKDTIWQKEFEDSFIYDETDSQIRSINEIKQDMQSDRPMDRLLCGDVGYGKTEVALRASFKAIQDGKQVAFLVPTTILARQHYETAKERFKDFPVTIKMLSRFETKANQQNSLKDLEKGKVDMIIGTHRLLSKDVKFKDLGLLIIDEEQRFGVKHKEKLKKLKENIDVLTLSATPIPRTLQMSLVGIRDMSTLDEPPENRSPINSYVIEYDPSIIREAILKEMDRNGQIYFVYNRVYDMDIIYKHLKELVPEAQIAMAHGQMTPKQLENVMIDFIDGKFDILLSTTIIETGMDIQNVNTIIVYDADIMGLSQLYQLKGRIGRSNRSSYAYFTYRQAKIISEVGEKRLKAIKDFSDFGSGYKIAMRDLELRGAGNILGESQSGHVDAIGYDLYVKYLKQAINNLNKEDLDNNLYDKSNKDDVYIDIKSDAYIPDSYIEDSTQKIEMYNRIAAIDDIKDYDEIVEDLIDRYGDIPVSVDNVMYVSLIKSLASKNGFYEIVERTGTIYIKYKDRNKFTFEQLSSINEQFNSNLQMDLSTKPSFKIDSSPRKLVDCYNLLSIIDSIRKGETNE